MPVNNNLTGVFKTLLVRGKMVIASSASQNQQMDVSAKNYIQGTPKNRIMDIGGVRENISIKAPILIGGGSRIDGRTLINERLNNILVDPALANLPLLKKATISITQQGAETSLDLLSDGKPFLEGDGSIRPFAVTSLKADDILDPATSPSRAYLDPAHPLGPTRVGKWFDFRVNLAGFTYYVMEGTINIEVDTDEMFFLQGKVDNNTLQLPIDPTMIQIAAGTQYPNFTIKGIKISGSGKAAVVLNDSPTDDDYTFEDYDYGVLADDSLNFKIGPGQTNVTTQAPGIASAVAQTFALEVWAPDDPVGVGYSGFGWKSLISGVDLSKSVVSSANFQVSEGVLTSDFTFNCWVK